MAHPSGPAAEDWPESRSRAGTGWPGAAELASGPDRGPCGGPAAAPPDRPAWPASGEMEAGDRDDLWGMLCYLGIPFLSFAAPLVILVTRGRSSRFVRQHAIQALNLSLTLLLYTLSALILGAMLALDTLTAALVITVPVLALLWLATLAYLVLAAVAAGSGEPCEIPRWICATIIGDRAGHG